MAYVPPALRRKQAADARGEVVREDALPSETTTSSSTDGLPSVDDIQNYFWPPSDLGHDEESVVNDATQDQTHHPDQSGSSTVDHQAGNTIKSSGVKDGNGQDPEPSFRTRRRAHPHSTLNSTASEPDKLKYILLFANANPRWNSDHIIFVKTNLHLLPQPPQDNNILDPLPGDVLSTISPPQQTDARAPTTTTSSPTQPPILIFEQGPYRSSNFTFIGHHTLTHIDILAPQSPQLVKMLEQKFTRVNKSGRQRQYQRDAEKWNESLSQRWAVLKFERVEMGARPDIKVGDRARGLVRGERRNEDERVESGSRKGVSEMSKEMRLGGGTGVHGLDSGT